MLQEHNSQRRNVHNMFVCNILYFIEMYKEAETKVYLARSTGQFAIIQFGSFNINSLTVNTRESK